MIGVLPGKVLHDFEQGSADDGTGAALVRAGLCRPRGPRMHGRRGRVVCRRPLRLGRRRRDSSLREAVPSAIAAVLTVLLTSEIVLRAFDLPGRGFWHRYGVVVASVCIGGAIEGAMLGCVFSLDGSLFPEAVSPGALATDPLGLVGVSLGSGAVGAVIGLMVGLVVGVALGLPLAPLLGALPDEG